MDNEKKDGKGRGDGQSAVFVKDVPAGWVGRTTPSPGRRNLDESAGAGDEGPPEVPVAGVGGDVGVWRGHSVLPLPD